VDFSCIHGQKDNAFKNIDALLARGSKGNGNYWPKSE
jgi:hypothetical protein